MDLDIHPITIFKTSIGFCAIAWKDKMIVRLFLPEKNKYEMEASISNMDNFKLTPPNSSISKIIKEITAHLAGKLTMLENVSIDISSCPPFHQKVYSATRRIIPGQTISYGDLAKIAGSPSAAQAVGQAMAKNPIPLIIPCHRVLAANDKIGGFSSPNGIQMKKELLAIEKAL